MQTNSYDLYEDIPLDLVVTRKDYKDGVVFPRHSHLMGQFAYAACGVITVETDVGNWAVPPLRAIWVPAGVPHAMYMRGPVTMLNAYIQPKAAQRLGFPINCQVFGVSPLVQQLLENAVNVPVHFPAKERDSYLVGLLLHELAKMPPLSLNTPMPGEPRLLRACNEFLEAPSLEIGIDDMAERSGMSRRTFTRQFRLHTGISFVEWRRQACLLTAVIRLGNGESSITRIAMELGYSSPSAFSTVFKSVLGENPSRYFFESS